MLTLKDPSLLKTEAYIDGQWLSATKTFPVINPETGKEIAHISDTSLTNVKKAIDAAEKAQKSWASKTAIERSNILLTWYNLILENRDDLAKLITMEMSKPIEEAKGEITYGAEYIQWFAEEGRRIYGDTVPGNQNNVKIIITQQPVGVAATITPWNFPNAMISRKVAPALAAGCTIVTRPSELTPLSALAMVELAERAAIPKGVFNVVPTLDAASTGKEFCENKAVKKLSFTGSTRVGKILMSQSAKNIQKLSLELGGNAPFIIFEDANLDKAVEGLMVSKFRNTGQTCVCANRIYVQSSVFEAFKEKLIQAVKNLKIGPCSDSQTEIGPLINDKAFNKVKNLVKDAKEKGAEILTGGHPHSMGGLYFEPTVLSKLNTNMNIAQEEIFGPIAPLYKFEKDEDVLKMANDTDFGLASYFYSNSINRIWKFMEDLEYGMVGVNTGKLSAVEAPFGGVKQSGIGREGSKYGIHEYLNMKYMCLNLED